MDEFQYFPRYVPTPELHRPSESIIPRTTTSVRAYRYIRLRIKAAARRVRRTLRAFQGPTPRELPGLQDDQWQWSTELYLPLWATFVESVIESPPATVLNEQEDRCACCFLPFYADKNTIPVRLPCTGQHVMCQPCALAWFAAGFTSGSNSDCPFCREVLFRRSNFRDRDTAILIYEERQRATLQEAIALPFGQVSLTVSTPQPVPASSAFLFALHVNNRSR